MWWKCTQVRLEQRPGYGWSAVAKRDIAGGQPLVTVPSDAFLTAATAAAPSSVCAPLLNAGEHHAELSEWQVRGGHTDLLSALALRAQLPLPHSSVSTLRPPLYVRKT